MGDMNESTGGMLYGAVARGSVQRSGAFGQKRGGRKKKKVPGEREHSRATGAVIEISESNYRDLVFDGVIDARQFECGVKRQACASSNAGT